MFMGEYSHNVDAKGRLIVPAKLREQLGNEFVVTKGLDPCLYVYPKEEWDKIEARFAEAPLTNRKARAFMRRFFAGAETMELDKQGRILLKSSFREYAGIKKEVVLLGVLTRVEIWGKETLDDSGTFDDDMDAFADQMAEMGLNI